MADNINFAIWLRRRYAHWRYGPLNIQRVFHPERRISLFSQWLGIDLDLLICWMSGEQPDPDSDALQRIALKLGPNVYDRLGLPRPMQRTHRLSFNSGFGTLWRARGSD